MIGTAETTTFCPPFDGVRVIDLSSGIAGGYSTKLLADLGCDVIKVETADGDPLRRWSASGSWERDGDPDGALFRFLHTSKRSVVADTGTPAGRATVLDLVVGAAIVVENWTPGVAESRGLGIDELRAVQPDVLLVSMSAFGRGGPSSGLAANEFTVQGWSGSISTRGTLDRPPVTAGGATGDWATGTFAALSAATFLHQTRSSGHGEHVDVSMLEALMLTHTTYAPVFASYLGLSGVPNTRTIELPGIEPASDGWVGICTISGQQFADFANLIGHPEWVGDPGWMLQNGRQQRYREFRDAVSAWTTTRTVAEIVEEATLWRIPVVPIGNDRTIPEFEQFIDRATFVRNPRGDGFLQPDAPYRFSDMSCRPFQPSPRLGEHSGSIEPASAGIPGTAPAWAAACPNADKPLRGLRVADFTAYWAGPFASQWCAAMGADVIHIESPTRPDGMRAATTRPMTDDRWYEHAPVFASVNAGKRGIAVDLSRPEGRAIALELVARCDVVIENFTPRVMPAFGLGWEELSAVRPDLIMVRMPAFGLTGPWADRTGFAQTMEQISGMAWRTGFPDGQPLLPRGACDPLAGAHAALALMAALEHRRRTGRGQLIEVTMVEASLNLAAELVIERDAYGTSLDRNGNRSHHVAPQGCYRCRPETDDPERWICISVEDDAQWRSLVDELGTLSSEFDALADPLLAKVDARLAAQDRIDASIGAVTVHVDRDELVERLTVRGVCCAPVWPARCLDQLDQPRARGFDQLVEHPVAGPHELWGMPVRAVGREGWVWYERPAPTIGEHNREIIGGLLGHSDESLADLTESGVIGDRWVTR